MLWRRLVAAWLAVVPPLAMAAPDLPRRLEPVTVLAGTPNYPSGAAEKGVQGTSLVQADLAEGGSFSTPRVHRSSGSHVLDQAALALLPRLQIAPGGAQSVPQPGTVLVPVAFRKDTLASLPNKTCADFNRDAAYFATTFPQRSLRDMPVFDLATAALVAALPAAQQVALARGLADIQRAVIAHCREEPQARFLALLLDRAAAR